ncbi:hypothetical protein [Nostoc sp. KVJ3]|uniref:hypothetical protein n=1 Tax=Nostoc sp. KVJ3 TaxID=457945 RepID=UPI0022383C5B|nr:hypothetical protein [Nostoc sp. KVJ3]
MGANEFNSESTPQQSDGDNRDADDRIEESESLLERVRAEQREFSARINSLTNAVKEYAQVLSDIRELRVQRAKERDNRIKAELESTVESHEELDYGYSGVEEQPSPQPITIEKEVYRAEPISKYGTMGLFTALFTLLIFLGFNQFIPVNISNDIDIYLRAILQRTDYSNAKLQRVEKRLGTDRNRR